MPGPTLSYPDVSDLDTRFSRLSAEYELRRSTAHAAVVRWDWYSWRAFDLRPLHYERDLLKPGRRLAERPPLDRDHHRIGFDTDDQPVAILEYSGFLGGQLYYETYRDYRAGVGLVDEAQFYADGRPIYLHQYRYEAGLIRSASSAATGGGGYEEYQYTGQHVTRISIYHAKPTHKPGKRLYPLAPYAVISAAYDDAGLSRLEIFSEGRPAPIIELKYERPPAGFTINEACRTVHRELVAKIPATVRGLAIDEPAYCVVLAYLPENPLDVMVHVGLDQQRRERLAEQSDTDEDGGEGRWIEDIWSPADIGEDTPVDLSAVADTARLLGQELSLADADDITSPRGAGSERGRELLCAVAADLNAYDWTQELSTTDDFVVYAVDFELADLDRNMPACLPPTRLALLRERGLL